MLSAGYHASISWHWRQQSPKCEPSGKKQREKQRLGITSALCIHVCTRMCARLAAFRMKSGNILVCPAEGSPLWHRWFISYPHPSLIRHFFVELSASYPSMGVWKKHCITLWSKKKKTIKLKTANLAILPFPCNKALHPQSMIVKNTRMILFSEYPTDQTTATLTHGMLNWQDRLP